MGLYCDLIRLGDQELGKCVELSNEEAIYALVQQSRGDNWFDIDKAWHGIHFILSSAYSTQAPFGFLLHGGRLLNDRSWEDMYGVDVPDMRAFDSVQVREISNALSSVTEQRFRRIYDPEAMMKHKIYPRIWEERKNVIVWVLAKYLKISQHLNYLVFHFDRLKVFIESAVDRDLGIVIKYHQ